MATKIEWTDETWNPVVGCSKCSPGCDNCYAERMAYRLACMGQKKYQATTGILGYMQGWNGKIYCDESALDIPLHWRKGRKIFVCSMGDLFHPSVPFEFIDKVFGVMFANPWHTYQILTKRPERWIRYIQDNPARRLQDQKYIWAGITIEHPDYKNRADILRQIPTAVRFLSIEPCLADMGELNLEELDQVIVGGESGPGARPLHPDWVRSIRDQCQDAGVPFFFKQWGEWELSCAQGTRESSDEGLYGYNCRKLIIGRDTFMRVGKKKAGCLLDGKEYKEIPK